MTEAEIERFVNEEIKKIGSRHVPREGGRHINKRNCVNKITQMILNAPVTSTIRKKSLQLFKKKPLSSRHKTALEKIKKYCTDKYKNVITIVTHGSIGISDTHPFSDIDAAIILATPKKTTQQEFLIHQDIILSLMFYDLKSFICTNLNDPFNGMMDRISIQKATVLYDPANCWQNIANATLNIQGPCLLNLKIVNKLWTLCIIYLGKIIASVNNKNFMYVTECSALLAQNAAHIILIINETPFVANRHLYKQAIGCPIKPKNFQDNLSGLLGVNHKKSFEQRAAHGLDLCQEIQKILYANAEYKSMHTLPISFTRYEQAVQKMLTGLLTA